MWALLHQSLIDMATDQFNLDKSSVEIPFSHSFRLCQVDKANQQATPCQLDTQKYHHFLICPQDLMLISKIEYITTLKVLQSLKFSTI